MNRCAVVVVAVAGVVGGFVLGALTQSRAGAPLVAALYARPASATVPVAKPAAALSPSVPSDYQAIKNQLAICMAFHPSASETDKFLHMCRGDLDMCRSSRPTLPDCYDFIDFAPIYELELGEADPSPQTLERAKSLSTTECVRVITWGNRAGRQQRSCLRGESPPGWKERYGRPVTDRPFVKACRTTDAVNAWFSRDEDRAREMGHEVKHMIWAGADGGLRLLGPDGGSIPWIPEDVP